MVRIPTADTNPDGGGLNAGWTHFMVESVETGMQDGAPLVTVHTIALEGPPGQRDKKFKEMFTLAGKAAGRFLKLLLACDLISHDQWRQSVDGGGLDIDVNENLLVGMQYCANVSIEPYKGKKAEHQGKSFPNTGFTFENVFSPAAKDCPKDAASMAQLTPPEGYDAGGNGSAAPQNPPAGGEASSAGGDDGWDDVK